MLRSLLICALLVLACCPTSFSQNREGEVVYPHPGFKPGPEVPAMPKALMKLPRTDITRAKYPVVDFHLHGSQLKTAADYEKLIKLMDQTGIGVICNMDGGFGKTFDQNMKVG